MSVDPLPEIARNFKEPLGRRERGSVGVLVYGRARGRD